MKIIGNIMISKTVEDMKKELKEQQESFELRVKTLDKQEETIMKKLNSIKSQVEGTPEKKETKEK